MMRNFIRDTVTAGINSKYGFTPLVDSFRGMWKMTHDKQFKADYYAQGLPMDTYIRNDIRGRRISRKSYGRISKSTRLVLDRPCGS